MEMEMEERANLPMQFFWEIILRGLEVKGSYFERTEREEGDMCLSVFLGALLAPVFLRMWAWILS
jgi:hypothetical protein